MPEETTGIVRIIHGALDELPSGSIILRGVIDPEYFNGLLTDSYQREIAPDATIAELMAAYRNGRVPDVELGMRGQTVDSQHTENEGEAWTLKNGVYIIDGLQRVTAARRLMEREANFRPRLGAAIHFGTTAEWERNRFRILNLKRNKVSPNVVARNMAEELEVVAMLLRLCDDKQFVMYRRVSWNQRMKTGEMITAVSLLKVIGHLHAHKGPGRSQDVITLAQGQQRVMDTVGPRLYRENIKTFFEVLNRAFNIDQVQIKSGAPFIKLTFMMTLAKLFSRHYTVFFQNDGKKLLVSADWVRKLAQFPIFDPSVRELCSAGGQAGNILYSTLIDHLNRGKRTQRLIEPVTMDTTTEDEDHGREHDEE